LSPHTGTSPDFSKLSLARSPSFPQIASASEYLLASKAIVGLPSTYFPFAFSPSSARLSRSQLHLKIHPSPLQPEACRVV
jgi:hypothetical protein